MGRKSDAKLEADYQAHVIDRLDREFPGCLILKNDSSYLQGVPDLTVFFRNMWAMLEVKAYEGAAEQPNQDYYVQLADGMSFGSFIYPENEEDVFNELQAAFRPRRATRLPVG